MFPALTTQALKPHEHLGVSETEVLTAKGPSSRPELSAPQGHTATTICPSGHRPTSSCLLAGLEHAEHWAEGRPPPLPPLACPRPQPRASSCCCFHLRRKQKKHGSSRPRGNVLFPARRVGRYRAWGKSSPPALALHSQGDCARGPPS